MTSRFIKSRNDRVVAAGDDVVDVYVWDIDKTYLDTRFSSFRGLLAIPFELAVDKNNVAGTVPLLRALRTGPDPRAPRFSPLYFVSGSPPGLRNVVEKKMTLDGVQFDGITFKDQLGLVLAGRPTAVAEQVGYKVGALLLLRSQLPARVRFCLFGDDVEKDMDSFLLFGAVCAGLRGGKLREEMRKRGAHWPEIEAVVDAAAALAPESDPVERVFIHSVKGRLLERTDLDPRVVVGRSFLQSALLLRHLGKVDSGAPTRVREDLARRRFTPAEIQTLIDDARVRLGVVDTTC
jgi:hypothetical protein